jgi:hypothetical protein
VFVAATAELTGAGVLIPVRWACASGSVQMAGAANVQARLTLQTSAPPGCRTVQIRAAQAKTVSAPLTLDLVKESPNSVDQNAQKSFIESAVLTLEFLDENGRSLAKSDCQKQN